MNISSNAVRALESLVICSICQKRLKSPKMLQCQHTFCIACLEMSTRQQGQQRRFLPFWKSKVDTFNFYLRCYRFIFFTDYIACSTCESKHTFASPAALLTDLPQNLYIDSVLQVLSQSTAGTSASAHQKQILSAPKSTSNDAVSVFRFPYHSQKVHASSITKLPILLDKWW